MKTETIKRGRGRPRAFDQDAVLDAVVRVFWKKGYAAASLDDLATAAGVTRPSLYTALGDKRSMYLKALERFAVNLDAQIEHSFSKERTTAQGLADFLRASLDLYLSAREPRGCLVMCTAPAEAFDDSDVRAALDKMLRHLDEQFSLVFESAQSRHEIPPSPPARARAQLASAAIQSLALRSRANQTRSSLLEYINAVSAIIAG
jgi:AcrR family transcriptional regulator